jgi:predicted RNase H-like HicB family nuclease
MGVDDAPAKKNGLTAEGLRAAEETAARREISVGDAAVELGLVEYDDEPYTDAERAGHAGALADGAGAIPWEEAKAELDELGDRRIVDLDVLLTQEGDLYVAQGVQMDVASQGGSAEEAIENLREALELFVTQVEGKDPERWKATEVRRIEVRVPEECVVEESPDDIPF